MAASWQDQWVTVDGWVGNDFEEVLDVFEANFDERGEVGAALCVYHEGHAVVDVWGGIADPATERPWVEDTIVLVYSSTKGVTSICVNKLIGDGHVDPAATVATYWPEFAANGKESITVAQLLSHQAGLPYVDGDMSLADALGWDAPVARLATQAPIWEPGTKHGYHMRTFGWLAGELIRRADPAHRTAGEYLRAEIADPLGVDFWIGLPESEEARVAPVIPPKTDLRAVLQGFGDDLLLARVFANPGGHFNYDQMWNTRALRAVEMPSSNGVGNARGLARLYASIIGEVDGIRTLEPATLAAASVEQACEPDEVIMVESCFGLGFMLHASFGAANPHSAIGHAGAGGSLCFADPATSIAFSYVMNDLRFDAKGDPRSEELVRAVYRSLRGS